MLPRTNLPSSLMTTVKPTPAGESWADVQQDMSRLGDHYQMLTNEAQGIHDRIAGLTAAPVKIARTDRGLVRIVENSDSATIIATLEAENAMLRQKQAEHSELVKRHQMLNELAEGYLGKLDGLGAREREWEDQRASDQDTILSLETTMKERDGRIVSQDVAIKNVKRQLKCCRDGSKSSNESKRSLEHRLSERTTEVSSLQREIMDLNLKHQNDTMALQAVKAAVLKERK